MTLLCKLFGHKFVGQSNYWKYDPNIGDITVCNRFVTDWCVRCGVRNPQLKGEVKK
jgi:hypothetical protein